MTLRRNKPIAARERRTQRAQIAALFVRLRTTYRTGQRVVAAVASLFNSLLRLVTSSNEADVLTLQHLSHRFRSNTR